MITPIEMRACCLFAGYSGLTDFEGRDAWRSLPDHERRKWTMAAGRVQVGLPLTEVEKIGQVEAISVIILAAATGISIKEAHQQWDSLGPRGRDAWRPKARAAIHYWSGLEVAADPPPPPYHWLGAEAEAA